MSRKNKSSDHRLLASGAAWIHSGYDSMGNKRYILAEGRTPSGYQSTGGAGRAKCACGAVSNIMRTRQQRVDWFKNVHQPNEYAEVPEWERRNNILLDLVERAENPLWGPSNSNAVAMTTEEYALWQQIKKPGVLKDLLTHYRKAKR